jgi:hypothetical protein
MIVNPDDLALQLTKVKDLPRLTAELMEIVNKIPYYCGKPDCYAPGCLAIRDARDKMREILNVQVPS